MLSPYRVLDLTDSRAELGPLILAGLGADVIKVEPPGGSASRHETPLDSALPAGMQSLRFHAFNRGKRSIMLDLDSTSGRAQFLRLVASADFVFENGALALRAWAAKQIARQIEACGAHLFWARLESMLERVQRE